jgi:hypothetical protein
MLDEALAPVAGGEKDPRAVNADLFHIEEHVGSFLEAWLEHEIKRRRRAKTDASDMQMVRGHMLQSSGP